MNTHLQMNNPASKPAMLHGKVKYPVQPKLTINTPGDIYEQEADAMADRVMRMSSNEVTKPITGLIGKSQQKKCAHCEEEEKKKPIMRKEEAGSTGMSVSSSFAASLNASKGSGSPLPQGTRSFMENAFSADFSSVKIHTGSQASEMSKQINAKAFTYGNDIYFDEKQYNTQSVEGKNLLLHELTHVVQQKGGGKYGSNNCNSQFIQRDPTTTITPSTALLQITDPVSENGPGNHGFKILVNYSGMPSIMDIRETLIETGISDASTLVECIVKSYIVLNGDREYFVFEHPTKGIVARALGSFAGYKQESVNGKVMKVDLFAVYAYLDDITASQYYKVGTSRIKDPLPYIGSTSDILSGNFSEIYSKISIIETRLEMLAKRYPSSSGYTIYGDVHLAQLYIPTFRRQMIIDPQNIKIVDTAIEILERIDVDLLLLDKMEAQLKKSKVPVISVENLRDKFGMLIRQWHSPTLVDKYNEVQLRSQGLTTDILLDQLEAHGQINQSFLNSSDELVLWVQDLRVKMREFYEKRIKLEANPSDAKLKDQVAKDAEFLEQAILGIQHFSQWLANYENMVRNRPGILDTPLIGAMSRLRDRVYRIKDAYDANNIVTLKREVTLMTNDDAVKEFYTFLPVGMQVTQMIARVGLATMAALASGGVGMITGGARAAATTTTIRKIASFAGTAALEAAVFSAINVTGSALLFGDKLKFETLLLDFAWDFGMFFILRATSKVSNSMLDAAKLKALSAPVQLITGYQMAHGWGLLRFRIENNRWPNKAELDAMNASALLMMAGIVVGTKVTQRWITSSKAAKALPLFYKEYGWRFNALESVRIEMGKRITDAEASGKGNDHGEFKIIQEQGKTLEIRFQELIREIKADRRFKQAQLRKEINELSARAPDLASEIVTQALGLPLEVFVSRAGKASYTYANGKTNMLANELRGKYLVITDVDPVTGLKTITATSSDAPTLLFKERSAAALNFNTSNYDVQSLMTEYFLTNPEAQKMLWRLLSQNGIENNAKQATTATRSQLKRMIGKDLTKANDILTSLYKTGLVRSSASPKLLARADMLEQDGILRSPEWLGEARELGNQRGIVYEWLVEKSHPAAAGEIIFRRIILQGVVFKDAAGTIPAKSDGTRNGNSTLAETDLAYVKDVSGTFEVNTVLNIKSGGGRGNAKSAKQQNQNFESLLKSNPGQLIEIQLNGNKRFVRINEISALNGTTEVNLTGKIKAASTIRFDTVGPKDASGFSLRMDLTELDITTIAKLLAERQMILTGQY